MSPPRLNISHVTLTCMAASSISFLLSSTQALCSQLQNQRNYQHKLLSKPDSALMLPKDRNPLTSNVFIITNRKRRSGKSKIGFSAKRADSFSYFTATSDRKGTYAASLSANAKFDETQKEEFAASLKAACDESASHKLVVFVHGYNSDLKVPFKLAGD
jgi:hypothetical protein